MKYLFHVWVETDGPVTAQEVEDNIDQAILHRLDVEGLSYADDTGCVVNVETNFIRFEG